LDHKDLTVYDISSSIVVGEKVENKCFNEFKCYINHKAKEFFLEIDENTPFEYFTRNTLINILNIAEKEDCSMIYACFRKDT